MSNAEFSVSQGDLAATRQNDTGEDIHASSDQSAGLFYDDFGSGAPPQQPPQQAPQQQAAPPPQQNQLDPGQQNQYPAYDDTPATMPGYQFTQVGQQPQNVPQQFGAPQHDARRQQLLSEAQNLGLSPEVFNLPTEQLETYLGQHIRMMTGQGMGFANGQAPPQGFVPPQQQQQQQQDTDYFSQLAGENPHKFPELDAESMDETAMAALQHINHSLNTTYPEVLNGLIGVVLGMQQENMAREANSALDALGDQALGNSSKGPLTPLVQMQRDQLIQSANAIRNGVQQQQGRSIPMGQAIAMAHRANGGGANLIRQDMQQSARARNQQIAGSPQHKTPQQNGQSEAFALWNSIQQQNAAQGQYG